VLFILRPEEPGNQHFQVFASACFAHLRITSQHRLGCILDADQNARGKREGVSIPVTPSFEPNGGIVTARENVTPERSVRY
jgi:hypothetical protein